MHYYRRKYEEKAKDERRLTLARREEQCKRERKIRKVSMESGMYQDRPEDATVQCATDGDTADSELLSSETLLQ